LMFEPKPIQHTEVTWFAEIVLGECPIAKMGSMNRVSTERRRLDDH
jgi:hypothetical protein